MRRAAGLPATIFQKQNTKELHLLMSYFEVREWDLRSVVSFRFKHTRLVRISHPTQRTHYTPWESNQVDVY